MYTVIMRQPIPVTTLHIVRWLPLAFAITVLAGFTYAAVQQNMRLAANEPQAQMATDIKAALSVNESPDALLPNRSVDISTSLSPFVILYDESGNPTRNTITGTDVVPVPPAGVFVYTRQKGEDRITWAPERGIRLATVVQHYKSNTSSGFVLVGRNLRETEKNEDSVLQMTVAAWLVAIVGSLGLYIRADNIIKK